MLENIAILVRLWFSVYLQGNTHLVKRIKRYSKDVWTAKDVLKPWRGHRIKRH